MADRFKPQEFDINSINGGVRYKNGDGIQADSINAAIEAAAFAQNIVSSGNSGTSNIESGEGSGSIQQTGYTQEGVYEDFRHYAAAYGVATAEGLDGVEAIEQLMSNNTYEQLLSKIAQANFGEDTEETRSHAQAYLYGMIDQVLTDNNLEFLPNEVNGSVSTGLGAGNTVWSPGSFVSGYNNIVGRKGYPFQAAFSATIGSNNVNNGMNSIVGGHGVTNTGNGSLTFGESGTYDLDSFDREQDILNATNYRNRLANIKETLPYSDTVKSVLPSSTTREWFTGHNFGNNSLNMGDNVTDGDSSITGGDHNWNFGHTSFMTGSQNILNKSYHTMVGGLLNEIPAHYNSYIEEWYYTMSDIVSGTLNFAYADDSIVSGYNCRVGDWNYEQWAAPLKRTLTCGWGLENKKTDCATRLGLFNEDKEENLFEFGIGTAINDGTDWQITRKNGMWLDEDGNFGVAGNVKVGTYLQVENVVRTPSVDFGTHNGVSYGISYERATLPFTRVNKLYIEQPDQGDNYAATIGQVKNMVANGGTKLYKHSLTFRSSDRLSVATIIIVSTVNTKVPVGTIGNDTETGTKLLELLNNPISMYSSGNFGVAINQTISYNGYCQINRLGTAVNVSSFTAAEITASSVKEL